MGPVDFVVIAVIAAVIGFAAWYIYKSRKKGIQCIGCPDAKSCASKGCGGNCSGCGGSCGKKN